MERWDSEKTLRMVCSVCWQPTACKKHNTSHRAVGCPKCHHIAYDLSGLPFHDIPQSAWDSIYKRTHECERFLWERARG